MKIKALFITTILSFIFLIAANADARYYNELEWPKERGGCKCIKPGCRIVKLGMTKGEVGAICGAPVRRFPARWVVEKWQEWGRDPCMGNSTALHQKHLYIHKKWKKSKIFKFRNGRLYEIYDLGTPLRTPRLPKTRYKKGPLELEQERQNAKKNWGRR